MGRNDKCDFILGAHFQFDSRNSLQNYIYSENTQWRKSTITVLVIHKLTNFGQTTFIVASHKYCTSYEVLFPHRYFCFGYISLDSFFLFILMNTIQMFPHYLQGWIDNFVLDISHKIQVSSSFWWTQSRCFHIKNFVQDISHKIQVFSSFWWIQSKCFHIISRAGSKLGLPIEHLANRWVPQALWWK